VPATSAVATQARMIIPTLFALRSLMTISGAGVASTRLSARRISVNSAFASATEGKLGYILGAFSRKEGEPDVGKFTLTLRKQADGRWLIFSDMDNGSRPGR